MISNLDTELLFPSRVIPALRDLRGETWHTLIEHVDEHPPTSPEKKTFVLMMVKLGGCLTCDADAYRAHLGCTECARQTIRRFRGEDQELIELYTQARLELERQIGS
ncbi:MAG: hypothetical protein HUU38_32020 [Anaerolineales bacterium]|nr:hypothetical protein [Anaerolineales bacterium]